MHGAYILDYQNMDFLKIIGKFKFDFSVQISNIRC